MARRIPISYVRDYDEEFVKIKEEWIPGIKELYSVSNYGRVRNDKTGKILTEYVDKDGYCRVDLVSSANGANTKTTRIGIHRLMLLAFDYNPNHRNLVPNHLDGVPFHNELSNLEWTDNKGNARHAIENGLHKMHGEDNPNGKLKESQVEEICELIQTGKYYDTEIAKMYNVSYANISDIHKGKTWKQVSEKYDLNKRKPLHTK